MTTDTPNKPRQRRERPPIRYLLSHDEAARELGIPPDHLSSLVRYGLHKPPRILGPQTVRFLIRELGERPDRSHLLDAPKRTVLYKAYDADGLLLYVGISGGIIARFAQHVDGSPWSRVMARMEVEWFATRDEALKAEKASIKSLRPLFNIAHADKRGPC
jgi:predicted GIY-YIG superfamily endonuclease